jgi:hypothetical protein
MVFIGYLLINIGMKYREITEAYSRENSWLLKYMKDHEFDPYGAWYEICDWLDKNDMFDMVSKLAGEEITSVDQLNEFEADLFYKLPADVQKECAEEVVEYIIQNNPAEAPSWAHMSLKNKKPLPNTTWLVHFSDDASSICHNGFKYGMDQMDKLGLTTYFKKDAKAYGGYNFAFAALSRYAVHAAYEKKYGRNAVIFQNSGVECMHHGDEEDQIIFWGADVNPKSIVYLKEDGGDWCVVPRDFDKREFLFKGTFEKTVNWVIQNYQQYRKVL